jgi:hypothetical protein
VLSLSQRQQRGFRLGTQLARLADRLVGHSDLLGDGPTEGLHARGICPLAAGV